jgi:hypothetical protein
MVKIFGKNAWKRNLEAHPAKGDQNWPRAYFMLMMIVIVTVKIVILPVHGIPTVRNEKMQSISYFTL